MIVALIDNGSLEPAATRNLRSVAAAISERTGIAVRAVSWKHSDRISPELLDGTPAWTLSAFVRAMFALGQREFVFVPFFISAQGAIGSALRSDLEKLQADLAEQGRLEFNFTDGLAGRGSLPSIIADRIRAAIAAQRLRVPPVVVVDHGGPSLASANLRNQLAAAVREQLGREVGPLAAASMEGAHPPLLADQLRAAPFAGREVVVAPLFLSPGRHAGPDGDIAHICAEAGREANTRTVVTELIGTHPAAVDALAGALRDALSQLHAQPFA
jgi:sirohydrochlorin ferrochelatase